MVIDYQQDIVSLVVDEFSIMDQLMLQGAASHVALVGQVAEHVVKAGGKRMRPLMTLLCGRAITPQHTIHPHVTKLASIVEMLHTATLVHDDVVDESSLRRGVLTANAHWNNATAVLVGDFLIARAFDLLVDIGQPDLLKLFSQGTCDIAEGEVLQLELQHNPDITEARYMQMIHGKTGRLFEVACEGAALLVNKTYADPLRAFAFHFGNAFQMVDDVLDYTADVSVLGKNIGDDLAEGKPTLPLVAAMRMASAADVVFIRESIEQGKTEHLPRIVSIVQDSGALAYCQQRVIDESQAARAALSQLPDSIYRQALIHLTELAIHRTH